MRTFRLAAGFERLDALEGKLCLPCNNFARIPLVGLYFRVVSRLGDGIAWYAMLAALPVVFGTPALMPALHMGLTALVGVLIYKALKTTLLRERPFASHVNVEAITVPLDRYSFPSGHTLHATAFLVMLAHYFPAIALIMLPFGLSVAASRVILGLHYPTDVLVGAFIGWVLAQTSLQLAAMPWT
jgi:undecaprenyl-diphosphatase